MGKPCSREKKKLQGSRNGQEALWPSKGTEWDIVMLLPLSLITSPSFYKSFEDFKACFMLHSLLELSLIELRIPSPLGYSALSSFALGNRNLESSCSVLCFMAL